MKQGIKRMRLIVLVFVLITISYRGYAKDIVKIISLEWPPYAGRHLPGQGTSLTIIRQAFEAAGKEVEFDFAPWNRGLFLFNSGRYDAIAPEYMNTQRQETCLFSKPFDVSPLGFVVLKLNYIQWERLEDLSGFQIGTVNGYVNTQAFDDLVARGRLKTQAANDDSTNILKVAMGRIPMAVIDQNVFEYLLGYDPRLKWAVNEVGFNRQILGEQKLFLCFQPTERGARLKALFDTEVTKLFK